MSLPELAIRRHVTTLMLILSLVVLGAVALGRLPLAFLPDMEEPELFVRIPYRNAAPEQVEHMIIRPVEDPLFVDARKGNFYLAPETQAIDWF